MNTSDIVRDAILTDRFVSVGEAQFPRGTVIVSAPTWMGGRDKGALWMTAAKEGWKVHTAAYSNNGCPLRATFTGDDSAELDLRDSKKIFETLGSPAEVIIDITNLGLGIWGPVLRAFMREGVRTRALYMRPTDYRRHAGESAPVHSPQYDFNTSFRGVMPVAGFGRLSSPASPDDALLMALLGLEGRRAVVATRDLDPLPETMPIFGLPGYSRRIAQRTIWSHREFLSVTRSCHSISYAAPLSPFEVCRQIEDVRSIDKRRHIYLLPFGTKPMNLGAILACLRNPTGIELIYDHPVPSSEPAEEHDSYYVFDITEPLTLGLSS